LPTFPPTPEQTAIVDAHLTGADVLVKAGAGSGKTSALTMLPEATPSKMFAYMAFNKSIADEAAGKFPTTNTEAKTFHGFAYRAVVKGTKFVQRLRGNKPSSLEVGRSLGITAPMSFTVTDEHGEQHERLLKTSTLAYIAVRTVERFSDSADTEISAYNVPFQDGLDKFAQAQLAAYIVPLAKKIWNDVSDEGASTYKFDHCHYLKLWQLAGPVAQVEVGGVLSQGKYGPWMKGAQTRKADVILFDEAQDANPVKAAIVKFNQARGVQIIIVGDEAQAIYGFTGAVNAMAMFDTEHTLKLTKSFRFGPAIAEVANKLLALMEDTDMQIVGHDPVPSEVLV
jgi:superfamily I DNA/RNA helicase